MQDLTFEVSGVAKLASQLVCVHVCVLQLFVASKSFNFRSEAKFHI